MLIFSNKIGKIELAIWLESFFYKMLPSVELDENLNLNVNLEAGEESPTTLTTICSTPSPAPTNMEIIQVCTLHYHFNIGQIINFRTLVT